MTAATPSIVNAGVTPLMQQYLAIKARFPNEILFFRLGDFYEMFYEDALKAAPLLHVTLTKRQTIPMCGIPHHAATGYISRLLRAGVSVAVAEQMEDPKKTKGMVKRDVVRVITPGTVMEEELLTSGANNFLVALAFQSTLKNDPVHWALAAVDAIWACLRNSSLTSAGGKPPPASRASSSRNSAATLAILAFIG